MSEQIEQQIEQTNEAVVEAQTDAPVIEPIQEDILAPSSVNPLLVTLTALSQSKGFVAVTLDKDNNYKYYNINLDQTQSYYAASLLKKTLENMM